MEEKQFKINHSKTFWTTFCKMFKKHEKCKMQKLKQKKKK